MKINSQITLPESELEIKFIRSPGPGGQHVNKTATAVQLRFNVYNTLSLPPAVKQRLLILIQHSISQAGDLIIKATRYRSQDRNKQDALQRLRKIILHACVVRKKRKKTNITKAVKEKRLDVKKKRSQTKTMRNKNSYARE